MGYHFFLNNKFQEKWLTCRGWLEWRLVVVHLILNCPPSLRSASGVKISALHCWFSTDNHLESACFKWTPNAHQQHIRGDPSIHCIESELIKLLLNHSWRRRIQDGSSWSMIPSSHTAQCNSDLMYMYLAMKVIWFYFLKLSATRQWTSTTTQVWVFIYLEVFDIEYY